MKENIPHLNNLLQLSRELMNDLKKEFNDSFTMIEKGCWTLYKSEKMGDHEKHLTEQAMSLGLKTQTYTPLSLQIVVYASAILTMIPIQSVS